MAAAFLANVQRRPDLLRVLEEHLATTEPHAAGTTDRLLERNAGDEPRAT